MAGGRDLLEKLKNDSQLVANNSAKQGLDDMSLLFNYVEALEAASNV
jgi:histidyl-tRNA synthetase